MSLTAITLVIIAAFTVYAGEIQPRYTNITRVYAVAEQSGDSIEINSALYAAHSMPLQIDVSVEDEDGDMVSVEDPSSSTVGKYLLLETTASCSPGHTYTVIVNFDADGETEQVVRTVRT